MSNVNNIKVEAMKVFYGIDTAQVEKIKVPLGISKASLTEKYFVVYATSLLGVISKHGFWFKVTIGDTAPIVADITFHEVDISGAGITTAQQIATETQLVIDALTLNQKPCLEITPKRLVA